MAYGVDHLVLPVRDLDVARARYEAMGFTVAPDARHPFGTENCCVFFANRTYLEPLAVASRIDMEANARKGLDFLRRYDAYRSRNGSDGFAMLAFTTPDAAGDQLRFAEAGVAGREVFSFERQAIGADGTATTIGVRLAFAIDDRSPDATLFACQHVNTEVFWQEERTTHANGALGIGEVVLCEETPADFQHDLQLVCRERTVRSTSLVLHVDLPKASVSVVTPAAFRALFGRDAPVRGRGLRLSAFVVDVTDRDAVARRLAAGNIAAETREDRLVVPPVAGQGTVIAFQEKKA